MASSSTRGVIWLSKITIVSTEGKMTQSSLNDFFLKSYIKKKALSILILSLILAILISFKTWAVDDKPTFVVNAIARVPGSFNPLPNVESFRDEVNKLPYYIEKDINTKKPSRGKVVCGASHPDENAYATSSVLGTFFDKITQESFSNTPDISQAFAHTQIKVAALLNKIKSVDESSNQEFYNVVDDLSETIEHKIIFSLWEPQWVKKVSIGRGVIKNVPVSIGEVSDFYNGLKLQSPLLAQAFLQINESQSLNSIVPYRELREVLLKDEATKSLVRSSRTRNPRAPIYISFMDADAVSLRTGAKGVFSCYEEAIQENPQVLHGLTTGYSVSMRQNPFASLAVSLDLANRRALSTVFPLAPYYPEPNTSIRVLDNFETLEVSFPEIRLNGHAHYTSPQELPLLMQQIVRSRFQNSNSLASACFKFLQQGDIETEVPVRFLQNRKKKDGTQNVKMFSGEFSQENQQFGSITIQDLKQVRNTSQSQLKTRDWSGLVYKNLEGYMKSGSIRVINADQPGSVVDKRKNLFLISMFSSIQSAYSPLAVTIREVKEHGYNAAEYLFSLIHEYDQRVPMPLNITFGNVKSTKLTGDLLRAHLTSYEGLYSVIDKFYQQPVARLVTQASFTCGRSEISVLTRYIQCAYKPAPPRDILNIKLKGEPQGDIKPLENGQGNIPKKEVHVVQNIYPKAQLTLPNIKTLLSSLHNGNKNKKIYYNKIDIFVGLKEGNASRIVNSSKQISSNIRLMWSKFDTQDWDTVLEGLSISLQDLAIMTNAKIVYLENAKNNRINFLDTFFGLR
jgi:hypothetical protein